MTKVSYRVLITALIFIVAKQAYAAPDFFVLMEGREAPSSGKRILAPEAYHIGMADQDGLIRFLSAVNTDPAKASTISLPTPDGKSRNFNIWKTPVMEEPLRSNYSNIQTFTATAQDNHNVTAKIDFTPQGFHAMVFDGSNTYLIDPYSNVADGYYLIYYKRNYKRPVGEMMSCGFDADKDIHDASGNKPETIDGTLPGIALKQNGNTRKTYRLALSCTGEYAQAVGGATPTVASVLGAMTTSMNRVNGIYERELSVTLTLIGNNDQLVYINPGSDPFTANNNGGLLLGQNQDNTDDVIGNANYDIGHIFSTGGGGIAFLGCVCQTNIKARGVTGSANPVGDPYDVDYVAHEMGHQFGANHTFNSCSFENDFTAYEPGSGSTIMAYAGICGPLNDLQQHSDAYFHAVSLDEITDYITTDAGSFCPATAVGSTPPTLPAIINSYSIPYKTPFELLAPAAAVGASDSLLYCWEQWDLGDLGSVDTESATFTQGPSFRTYFPRTSRWRVFPRIDSLIENKTSYMGERLPAVARILHFKVTARNLINGFGAFDFSDDQITLDVINTGQPFAVTSPNLSTDTAYALQQKNVTWNIAQTDVAPISTANVDIYLSVDGGYTYPFTLASGVPNNGSATVTMPDTFTSKARIKVKGAGNVFFDISNADFKLLDTNVTAINDIQLEHDLSVFPNPATNQINIVNKGQAELSLSLYNALGQKLWSGVVRKNATMPVAAYARGLYYLRVYDKQNGSKTVKRITLQ